MFAAVAYRRRGYDRLFNFEDHPGGVKKRLPP
jgi:hypothetical protein